MSPQYFVMLYMYRRSSYGACLKSPATLLYKYSFLVANIHYTTIHFIVYVRYYTSLRRCVQSDAGLVLLLQSYHCHITRKFFFKFLIVYQLVDYRVLFIVALCQRF